MKENIDLLLIKPKDSVYGQLSAYSAIEPPLWATLIGSYIRENGYSAKIIDTNAENIVPKKLIEIIEENYIPQLVCFIVTGNHLSASTSIMPSAREYHNCLKKIFPEIKTMFWGLHPSSLPERTIIEEKTDFVCQGEGFETIRQLLDVLKKNLDNNHLDHNNTEYSLIQGLCYNRNEKIILSSRPPLINLDELPNPAWDLLPIDKYRAHGWHCFDNIDNRDRYGVIFTSLGCPFNCDFCALKTFNGKPGIRYRSPKKVIEDIDILVKKYNVKNIKILDECFILNQKHVDEICNLLIQRKQDYGYDLNLWCYGRVDTVNEYVLKKMKEAGIYWIALGIEAANSDIRESVNKKFGQEKIKKVVEMIKKVNVNIIANFMFGLPNDTLDTMQETLNLAKELNCEYVNFYCTSAYPGSQLYSNTIKKEKEENIKILPDNWEGYNQYSKKFLPLPTKYLTSKEILEFRDKAFQEYFSDPRYLKMIEEKFGKNALRYIEDMLKYDIRKFNQINLISQKN